MAERENLPPAIAVQASAVLTERRGSLVARGLAALKEIGLTTPALLCFTNKGYCIALDAAKAPQVNREWCATDCPQTAQLLVPNRAPEKIIAVLRTPTFDENYFIFMATAMGTVKKTPLTSFANPRKAGIIAVGLDDGDHLIGVAITNGQCDVMLFSDAGKAVRFAEDDVRPMGREARGVRGMMLEDGQKVISMLVADSEDWSVLTATENGYGKRTPIAEYTRHGRGTKGMIAIQTSDNGKVVGTLLADDTDEVILSTSIDRRIRTCVSGIPETRRATQGVLLVQLQDNERLVGLNKNSRLTDSEQLAALLNLIKQQIFAFIEGLFTQGLLYRYGENVDVDIDKARSLFVEAAELKHVRAQHELAQLLFDESESIEGAELFKQGRRYRYGEDGTQVDDEKARDYFIEAADLEHAEAQFELARLLFEDGESEEAQAWLETSAMQGFGPAIHCLDVECNGLYGLDEDEQGELLQQARKWYESRVLAGDAKRQFEFSELLLDHGEWCGDPKESLRWLIASAEQDYSEACYRLGHWYLRGEVSEYSTRQGIYWLARAAELGWLSAYEDLGDLYLLGHGTAPSPRIAPDKVVAVAWYERVIAKGMRRVAYKLGNHYLAGAHLDQDLFLAEKWLLHAAHEGSASAQQTLGEEYASGVRLRQDADAAIQWLKLAADNQISAGLKLAEIFLDGKITPSNFEAATEWLSRVALHGALRNRAMKMMAEKCFDGRFSAEDESYAQAWLDRVAKDARKLAADTEHPLVAHHAYEFAELYELGLGVEQDMEKAIHWYKQSAEQGSHAAQKRLKELGIEWKAP